MIFLSKKIFLAVYNNLYQREQLKKMLKKITSRALPKFLLTCIITGHLFK